MQKFWQRVVVVLELSKPNEKYRKETFVRRSTNCAFKYSKDTESRLYNSLNSIFYVVARIYYKTYPAIISTLIPRAGNITPSITYLRMASVKSVFFLLYGMFERKYCRIRRWRKIARSNKITRKNCLTSTPSFFLIMSRLTCVRLDRHVRNRNRNRFG